MTKYHYFNLLYYHSVCLYFLLLRLSYSCYKNYSKKYDRLYKPIKNKQRSKQTKIIHMNKENNIYINKQINKQTNQKPKRNSRNRSKSLLTPLSLSSTHLSSYFFCFCTNASYIPDRLQHISVNTFLLGNSMFH